MSRILPESNRHRGRKTDRTLWILALLFVVVIGILLYRRYHHRQQDFTRYREAYRAAQERAQIEYNIGLATHHNLYFASLGATTKDRVIPAMVGGQPPLPEHPR